MIASLALSHKIGSAVMDIIFLITSDHSFNPSEMTLRKTEDIYIHLLKRSFTETGLESNTPEIHNRMIESATNLPPTTHKSIPPIILDAVIAWIDESSENRTFELKHILRNLAFVQRRYFQSVRRVLGRRLYIKERCGRKGLLRHCLANPSAGPWTRQLYLGISIPDNAAPTMNTLNVALTKRITGLRELTWAFSDSLLSTDLLVNTFELLGSVNEFVLGLKPSLTDKGVSASHHRSIISMPSLKTLKLQHWDIPSMLDVSCEGLPHWFDPLKPSPFFRMLHLYKPRFRFQNLRSYEVQFQLFWTRDSHDTFFLSTLVVQFPRGLQRGELQEVCGCLLPLLHRLEVLYIEGLRRDQEEYLLWFLDRSSKTLRKLSFQSIICPSEAALRSVSRTIRTLSLHLGDHQISEAINRWEDVDARLHGLISSDIWPELNTLNISFSYKTNLNIYSTYESASEIILQLSNNLPRIKALCKERHIEVTLTKSHGHECLYEEYKAGILEGLDIMESVDLFME